MTQISTWFANARRRLKNEAKTMSPSVSEKSDSLNDVSDEVLGSLKRRNEYDENDDDNDENNRQDKNPTHSNKSKKQKIWSIVDVVHDQW